MRWWTSAIFLTSVVVVSVLAVPYLFVHVPEYSSCDTGMVSQEDFDKAHSVGPLRQGSRFSPAPTHLVDPDDPYVQDIASSMDRGSDREKVREILYWMSHNIKYESDSVLYGCSEYWAVPAETLYYMKGDCEDFAILFCSIAMAMDLKVVLLDYTEHSSAGVYLNDKLYYCDAMNGLLHSFLDFEGEEPDIYEIGKDRMIWLSRWMHDTSRWERSLFNLPIGF